MADKTGIEWCDSTFNPWIGCTKVSPACDNCYAEATDARGIFGGSHWGAGVPRKRTSAANWRKPLAWNDQAFVECPECGWRGEWREADARSGCCPSCNHLPPTFKPARRRVFCASLADVFDNEVDPNWRIDLLHLIAETPNLDWLLLTKRIGNTERMLDEALAFMSHGLTRWSDVPWPNVWIGATICNQEEADRDIPKLLAVPADVRFLSIEPMLGPISLPFERIGHWNALAINSNQPWATTRLHWVIVGGESGPSARPMHPAWVRSLRDQCAAAGVPFLFKQWGGWLPVMPCGSAVQGCGVTPSCEPKFLFAHDHHFTKVGKMLAGRLLDGVEHNGYPETHQ